MSFQKTLTDTYSINSQDVDINGFLKPSRLTGHMQETAWHHAINLGFGPDFLHSNGLGWVLSAIRIQLEYLPRWMEDITIETWPTGMERLFYLRDFYLYDNKGDVFGKAVSQWLMIDVERKRPKIVENQVLDEVFNPQRRALEGGFEKSPKMDGEEQWLREVEYSDLDMNQHVNSNRYIDWMLNTFEFDYLSKHQLTGIQLEFKKEVLPDKLIDIKRMKLTANIYLFEGWSQNEKVMHFQSKMTFSNLL